MSVEIKIYSRLQIIKETTFHDDNLNQYPNDYFICVNATGGLHAWPRFKKEHNTVLNINFDDTDVDKEKWLGPIKYFARACTETQAKEIVNFIDKIPNGATVHVYCTRGQSRSPAIGQFIQEYKNKKAPVELNEDMNFYLYKLLHTVSNTNNTESF